MLPNKKIIIIKTCKFCKTIYLVQANFRIFISIFIDKIVEHQNILLYSPITLIKGVNKTQIINYAKGNYEKIIKEKINWLFFFINQNYWNVHCWLIGTKFMSHSINLTLVIKKNIYCIYIHYMGGGKQEKMICSTVYKTFLKILQICMYESLWVSYLLKHKRYINKMTKRRKLSQIHLLFQFIL